MLCWPSGQVRFVTVNTPKNAMLALRTNQVCHCKYTPNTLFPLDKIHQVGVATVNALKNTLMTENKSDLSL